MEADSFVNVIERMLYLLRPRSCGRRMGRKLAITPKSRTIYDNQSNIRCVAVMQRL